MTHFVSVDSRSVQTTEGAFQRPLELAGGAVHGLVDRRGVMRDGGRLMAFKASLHHALLVLGPALVAMFIAQVHLHSRDLPTEVSERGHDDAFDHGGQGLSTLDVVIRIQQDMHSFSFLSVSLERGPPGE
jgi:hypothetical protein